MSDSEQRQHALITRAAWLYYKDDLTQAQIAELLYVSRPTVGRLLDAARRIGIVSFDISPEHLGVLELSGQLCEHWALGSAVVVPRSGKDQAPDLLRQRLAVATSEYLRARLRPGMVVGVAWGSTVTATLLALQRQALRGVTFATLSGGIDAYTHEVSAGTNNVREQLRVIPAPLLASTVEIASALRRDESVVRVLDLAESAETTLTGIGSYHSDASGIRYGVYRPQEVAEVQAAGGVGDMIGEWFDARGRSLRVGLTDRKIGLSLEHLRALPNVVGIAGGLDKVTAICGALRGGYLDVLITDEDAAEALLGQDRELLDA